MTFLAGPQEWAQVQIGSGDVAALLEGRGSSSGENVRAKEITQAEKTDGPGGEGLDPLHPFTSSLALVDESKLNDKSEQADKHERVARAGEKRLEDDEGSYKVDCNGDAQTAAEASGADLRPPPTRSPTRNTEPDPTHHIDDDVSDIFSLDAMSVSFLSLKEMEMGFLRLRSELDIHFQRLVRVRMDLDFMLTAAGREQYLAELAEEFSTSVPT
jgi:hypothetical protein